MDGQLLHDADCLSRQIEPAARLPYGDAQLREDAWDLAKKVGLGRKIMVSAEPASIKLNTCGAPGMDEPPNYSAAHTLNSIFLLSWKEPIRRTVLMYLRRVEHAVREYRTARETLEAYVKELPQRNNHFLQSLRAVNHFEQCAGATCQAFALLKLICRRLEPSRPELKDDRVDRLRKIWNRSKHFDEDLEEGKLTVGDIAAPVWITNGGVEAATAAISFVELHAIVTEFLDDAKILAEDFPRKISEEHAAREVSRNAAQDHR